MTFDPTDEQRRIIAHRGRHALVAAVAGAGKSTTLIERVAGLLDDGARPDSVLMCTFTVKAAESMRTKLRARRGPTGVEIRTLHSIAHEIVRTARFGGRPDFIIAAREAWRVGAWTARAAKHAGVTGDEAADAIRRFWACGASPRALSGGDDPLLPAGMSETALDVVATYLRMRFSDEAPAGLFMEEITSSAVDALRRTPELLRRVRGLFRHIMVDEYQDTDPAQNVLLELIGGCPQPRVPAETRDTPCDVMAVGDDDQTLYAYRGVNPVDFHSFKARWEADLYFMQDNFRSGAAIIDAANALIAENRIRIKKELRCTRGEARIGLLSCTNQAGLVEAMLAEKTRLGAGYGDMAILSRTNAGLGMIEIELAQRGVPFKNDSENGGFFSMTEIRTLLAYMTLAVDPRNANALAEVWTRPSRYLRKEWLECRVDLVMRGGYHALRAEVDAPPRLSDLIAQLDRNRDHDGDARDMLRTLLSDIGDRMFDEMAVRMSHRRSASEMREAASRLADGFAGLSVEAALRRVDEAVRWRKKMESVADAVELLTVHRSKGLEFEIVGVGNFADGHMPHRDGDLEDERRIAYVALTRAKTSLLLQSPLPLTGRFCRDAKLVPHGDGPETEIDALEALRGEL